MIPSRGVSQTSGTPFPANLFSDIGISGNPAFAGGSATCRYDFTREVDNIPRTTQESYLGRFSYRPGPEHTLAAEAMHARSTNQRGWRRRRWPASG